VIIIFNGNIAYRGWKRITKIARARESQIYYDVLVAYLSSAECFDPSFVLILDEGEIPR